MAGEKSVPSSLEEISTPCFLVDIGKVENNCRVMRERCTKLGVKLRPHMKTAKTIEAGVLATAGSKRGICVSTLSEAEFYADAGFDDILFAMLFAEDKIPRLISLADRLEAFHVVVDNPAVVSLLERHPLTDKTWSAYMIVDTGDHREGSVWSSEATVDLGCRLAASDFITLHGLYTHEGNSYDMRGRDQVSEVADTAVDRIRYVDGRLREKGVQCGDVTIGSTPTASLPGNKVKDITEIHAGNYVFYDSMQNEIGACQEEDIACQVATRVIGQYPHRNRVLVDAGWTSLSLDGKLANGSYGRFKGFPHLKLEKMNQEYGFAQYDPEFHNIGDFPIGTLLYLYPYHLCATASCHRRHIVHREGRIVDVWMPCSQW